MTESLTLKWPIRKKFLFLFILSYSFFYIFPFPFEVFPQLDFIFNIYERLNDGFVLWIGKNILHLKNFQKLIFSDSGDTSFDFVRFFIFLILSVITALAILLIDKKRNNYETLSAYLFMYIRYCIGFYMLVYGFDKVFKSHFYFPSLEKLEQTFGESSPQGLLWAFMGYSTGYTVYLGIVEVLSGFLLFFRRTTAIGALLVLMIMINVVLINFSYDVPVKLFALHMVAYALLLLSPFFNSIFSFFILKKETKLAEQPLAVFHERFLQYRKIIKPILIICFTLLFIRFSYQNMQTYGDSAAKPPLYGIYKIEKIAAENKRQLTSMIFDRKLTVLKMNGVNHYFEAAVDTIDKRIFLMSTNDQNLSIDLKYESTGNKFVLIENDSTRISFNKINLDSLALLSRKFHWVVEHPVNN